MLDSQPIGMGCVFDLVRGVLASNKGGDVEGRGHSYCINPALLHCIRPFYPLPYGIISDYVSLGRSTATPMACRKWYFLAFEGQVSLPRFEVHCSMRLWATCQKENPPPTDDMRRVAPRHLKRPNEVLN